jgi:peroxiredoxin
MAHGKRKLVGIGDRVSDFSLPRLDGGDVSLNEILANAPALLAFYKVSCPVCQFTLPFLNRLHTPGTLPVYAVSQNDSRDTRDFNRRFGVSLPTLLDTEENGFAASNQFGITTVPTLFLVERDGTVSQVTEGWRKAEIQQLGGEAGVNPFRAGESVPEAKAG